MREGTSFRHIHGVDFSGAKDAGAKIWITTGARRDGTLQVESCQPAAFLPNSGKRPDLCLQALGDFIRSHPDGAFGCDFPFGLPRKLVREASWEEFVLAFGERYPTSEGFRRECALAAGGRELRRTTDREARAPFCAYNLRLYRQTYHGIRDVLAPLVRERAISVVPMQAPREGRALVLETCPASTLKRAGMYRPYKGKGPELRAARERILDRFEGRSALLIASGELRQVILDDPGGDAVDSVIAALTTSRVVADVDRICQPRCALYSMEGFVYA